MKQHNFPDDSFIGGWYISKKICDELVSYFKDNKSQHLKGTIGDNYENDVKKKSIELLINCDFFIKKFSNYFSEFNKCLELYKKKYEYSTKSPKIFLSRHTNLQKYNPGQGYYKWHFEDTIPGKRYLVFMTYLNDVKDGGTEFKYQNLTTPAKKGLTLIWPVYWTHTHRGQISNTKTKYITTGWFYFYE